MLSDISPLAQAALGTIFTWGLTAAGAGLVVVFNGTQASFHVFLLIKSRSFFCNFLTVAKCPIIDLIDR